MKKDISIQVIRVIAMISIVICHIMQATNNNFLRITAQFFNVGVYIFLIISGFLYSNKVIEPKKFFKGRFFRIILPMYIFMIPIFIIQLTTNSFNIKKVIIYFLNVQGIFGGVEGAAHLWFVTSICICYFLVPLFQIIKKKDKKNIYIFNLILVFITIIVSYCNRIYGNLFICICAYSFGYFLFEKIYNKKNYRYTKIGLIFLFDIFFRILIKRFFDETVFYDLIIVGITQIIASVCIIITIKKINKERIKSSKLLNILDRYSFYIYITHYFFMTGRASVMNITRSWCINIVIMLLFSIVYAIILYKINNYIEQKILKIEEEK